MAAALVCVECGCRWTSARERWRAYLTVDDEVGLYCPRCAAREFDDDA